MFRFRRGAVLALVVLAVAAITIAAPEVIGGIDGRIGSYAMVGVACAALALWLGRRKRRG